MKAVKLFLAVIFIVAISFGMKAQDKYEYATVVYRATSSTKGLISVSKNGNYTQNDVKITEGIISENLTPVIETVNKLNAEGWDVYSNNVFGAPGGGVQIYYFLRKKKS